MLHSSQGTGLSPIEWFGALSENERSAVLRQVFSVLDAVDPDGNKRREAWARGEMVRVDAGLPLLNRTSRITVPRSDRGDMEGVATLRPKRSPMVSTGIHIGVDGAVDDLWQRTLHDLRSGTLEFIPNKGEVGAASGLFAPLDGGVVEMKEDGGDLVVVVRQRERSPLPLEVGQKSPIALFKNTVRDELHEGQHIFIGAYSQPSEEQREAARSAPVQIGITRRTETMLDFHLRVPGLTQGWISLPFSLTAMLWNGVYLNRPNPDGTRTIVFAFADYDSGIVETIRHLKLSAEWTAALETLLQEHRAVRTLFSDPEALFFEILGSFNTRRRTANEKDFIAMETATDILPADER